MYKHVNVTRKHEKILSKFTNALDILEQGDEEIFFNVINFLGCYVSALFKSQYSASDCCNTAETLENIFEITNRDERVDYNNLENIFKLNSNRFYNFKIMGKNIPFHNFVVINYQKEWFLIQSFSGVCYLNVFQDKNIPLRILQFIKNPNTQEYNNLFRTKLPENQMSNIEVILSYQQFDKLPVERLKYLLRNYINNSIKK